jgi:hypothetical protein
MSKIREYQSQIASLQNCVEFAAERIRTNHAYEFRKNTTKLFSLFNARCLIKSPHIGRIEWLKISIGSFLILTALSDISSCDSCTCDIEIEIYTYTEGKKEKRTLKNAENDVESGISKKCHCIHRY